jgi:hypothetical protein
VHGNLTQSHQTHFRRIEKPYDGLSSSQPVADSILAIMDSRKEIVKENWQYLFQKGRGLRDWKLALCRHNFQDSARSGWMAR